MEHEAIHLPETRCVRLNANTVLSIPQVTSKSPTHFVSFRYSTKDRVSQLSVTGVMMRRGVWGVCLVTLWLVSTSQHFASGAAVAEHELPSNTQDYLIHQETSGSDGFDSSTLDPPEATSQDQERVSYSKKNVFEHQIHSKSAKVPGGIDSDRDDDEPESPSDEEILSLDDDDEGDSGSVDDQSTSLSENDGNHKIEQGSGWKIEEAVTVDTLRGTSSDTKKSDISFHDSQKASNDSGESVNRDLKDQEKSEASARDELDEKASDAGNEDSMVLTEEPSVNIEPSISEKSPDKADALRNEKSDVNHESHNLSSETASLLEDSAELEVIHEDKTLSEPSHDDETSETEPGLVDSDLPNEHEETADGTTEIEDSNRKTEQDYEPSSSNPDSRENSDSDTIHSSSHADKEVLKQSPSPLKNEKDTSKRSPSIDSSESQSTASDSRFKEFESLLKTFRDKAEDLDKRIKGLEKSQAEIRKTLNELAIPTAVKLKKENNSKESQDNLFLKALKEMRSVFQSSYLEFCSTLQTLFARFTLTWVPLSRSRKTDLLNSFISFLVNSSI